MLETKVFLLCQMAQDQCHTPVAYFLGYNKCYNPDVLMKFLLENIRAVCRPAEVKLLCTQSKGSMMK